MLDRLKSLLYGNPARHNELSLRLDDLRATEKSLPGDQPRPTIRTVQANCLAPRRSGATGITFLVDDVANAQKPLQPTTLGQSLQLRAGTPVLAMPDHGTSAIAPEGFVTDQHPADRHEFLNPLLEAVHLAFSDHRPLVVSPDCIWLTIVQGFGLHLLAHAEQFRGRIVQHQGQKELCVKTLSLDAEHWPQMIAQFSAQIRDHSDPVLYETLRCDFSTTTPTIPTACDVALMDAYQRYFVYIVMCVCGIPSITLEGTPEDWRRIRERLEVLATFGLEWWTARLVPILDEFVATAEGGPDLAFWRAIYKPEKAYAADVATGWIADLFPYVGRPPHRVVNPLLKEPRRDWLPREKSQGMFPSGLDLRSVPCGLSRAPVTVIFQDATKQEFDLLGGFCGISQNEEDFSLAPIISWAVVERDTRPPQEPIFE